MSIMPVKSTAICACFVFNTVAVRLIIFLLCPLLGSNFEKPGLARCKQLVEQIIWRVSLGRYQDSTAFMFFVLQKNVRD